jgi:hypothetical protein
MSQRRNQPIALRIDAKNTEENLKAQRGMSFRRARVFEKYATTAAYVDSLVFDKRLIKTCVITLIEKGGAQSIYYKVLACIDPEDWHEILGETSLAASAHIPYAVSDPWAYVKLQAKNDSGSGIVTAFISGQTP